MTHFKLLVLVLLLRWQLKHIPGIHFNPPSGKRNFSLWTQGGGGEKEGELKRLNLRTECLCQFHGLSTQVVHGSTRDGIPRVAPSLVFLRRRLFARRRRRRILGGVKAKS